VRDRGPIPHNRTRTHTRTYVHNDTHSKRTRASTAHLVLVQVGQDLLQLRRAPLDDVNATRLPQHEGPTREVPISTCLTKLAMEGGSGGTRDGGARGQAGARAAGLTGSDSYLRYLGEHSRPRRRLDARPRRVCLPHESHIVLLHIPVAKRQRWWWQR
jgi:hypothetical protein